MLGAWFLYYGLKAVQLTGIANRVWKRAAEYSLHPGRTQKTVTKHIGHNGNAKGPHYSEGLLLSIRRDTSSANRLRSTRNQPMTPSPTFRVAACA